MRYVRITGRKKGAKMTMQSWTIYLILVAVATSTPGPAVVYIVTNSSLYGWKKAVFAALGNIFGLLCLGTLAISGLGTILHTSAYLFSIIKYAGATYLVYLGLRMIMHNKGETESQMSSHQEGNVSSVKLFVQAFGIAVSNPKAIVFLTALLPQFITVGSPLIPQFTALIVVLMLSSFLFLMLYAQVACKAKAWFKNSRRDKAIKRTSGSVFVGMGFLLLTAEK